MSDLLDLADFKAWAHTSLSADDNLNSQAIEASASYIGDPSRTARTFTLVTVATVATARTFRPATPCTDILWIQDCASITSVVEDGTTLVAGTDYDAEPYGNRDDAGEYRPYDRLYRHDACWYSDGRKRPITVTGKWGWTTLPPLAVEAVKVLAADWLSMRESRNGIVSATSDGFSIGARTNPLVEQAIQALRGPLSIGVA